MKNRRKRDFFTALGLLGTFALWTALIRIIDVKAIGPQGSAVGFAALNGAFHRLTGVHMSLYVLTDLLSAVPLGIVCGFALLGLVQWVSRRRLSEVDRSLLVLGGFYITVLLAFVFFEVWVINYRPVLIEGVLEASYPSSTTTLVLTVMPTALIQLKSRIRSSRLRRAVLSAGTAFTAFMVIGRVLSGVHWASDIIGGTLLSAGLVLMYRALAE